MQKGRIVLSLCVYFIVAVLVWMIINSILSPFMPHYDAVFLATIITMFVLVGIFILRVIANYGNNRKKRK